MNKKGYIVKEFTQPTKRYALTLELKNDPELIAEYKRLHSNEVHWKEIRDEIREVGILEMEIFISGNHLFMIVETPLDFDWDEAFEKLAKLPRQQEWEELVGKYQICDPKATSNEKWKMMERFFFLYP